MSATSMSRDGTSVKNPGVLPLDDSIKGHKAVLVINKKPIYGTIQKVESSLREEKGNDSEQPDGKLTDAPSPNDVIITLLREDGGSVSFTAGAKLERGEFKLISEDVYEKWVYANQENVINQISRSERGMEYDLPEENCPPFKPSSASPSVIRLGKQHMPRSPSIEILDGNTKSEIGRMEEKSVVEQVVDNSLEGKTALVFIDEIPIFGTVSDVDRLGNEVYIQMLTNNEKTVKFEAASKIANDDFMIISGHVYKKWTEASEKVVWRSLEKMVNRRNIKKKKEKLPIFNPRVSSEQKLSSVLRTVSGLSTADLLSTYEDGCYNLDINAWVTDMSKLAGGDIVQTKVLSGRYKGSFFARAEVLTIEGDSIDLRVLLPEKWKVAGTAYRVPKNCIRAIPKDQLQKYVVPLELDIDHSIMFVQCSKLMKIKELKSTICKLRGIDQSLMSLETTSGRHLSDECKIPNDTLICQVQKLKQVDSITRRLTEYL